MPPFRILACLLALAAPVAAHAQVDHSAHAGHQAAALPTLAGQDAYGAIAEIVRLLEADPTTDWSRVNVERLRQHLIDMHVVTLQSTVTQRTVPGGLEMRVTGTGRTADAIRRMTRSHGAQLAALGLTASSTPIEGGALFTVVAADRDDEKVVGKIRGLGFIGLMTLGNHHAPHHLAMARGAPMPGH